MTYEATLVFETEIPLPFTVSNTTGIEKGTALKMTDPMTAIITSGAADTFAGIAATEKIANDGKTKIGVYRGGIFKVYLSGSCTVGDIAVLDAVPNYFKSGTALTQAALSGSRICGTFLETGATNETVLMELHAMGVPGY
jgi:hypothetical protein